MEHACYMHNISSREATHKQSTVPDTVPDDHIEWYGESTSKYLQEDCSKYNNATMDDVISTFRSIKIQGNRYSVM